MSAKRREEWPTSLDPFPGAPPPCRAMQGEYVCHLPEGHAGQHVDVDLANPFRQKMWNGSEGRYNLEQRSEKAFAPRLNQ
jgi:hypothetical protein